MYIVPFIIAALAGFAVMAASGGSDSSDRRRSETRSRRVDRDQSGPSVVPGPEPKHRWAKDSVVRPVEIRETIRIPYQEPHYVDPQKNAMAHPGLHPQSVQPSISELIFPTGWSVEYLPTAEAILDQSVQMGHTLNLFMRPYLARQVPVFAYRVLSPSGATTGSIAVAFLPDGSYRVVASRGPGSRSMTPESQVATSLFAAVLNGQSVQA